MFIFKKNFSKNVFNVLLQKVISVISFNFMVKMIMLIIRELNINDRNSKGKTFYSHKNILQTS